MMRTALGAGPETSRCINWGYQGKRIPTLVSDGDSPGQHLHRAHRLARRRHRLWWIARSTDRAALSRLPREVDVALWYGSQFPCGGGCRVRLEHCRSFPRRRRRSDDIQQRLRPALSKPVRVPEPGHHRSSIRGSGRRFTARGFWLGRKASEVFASGRKVDRVQPDANGATGTSGSVDFSENPSISRKIRSFPGQTVWRAPQVRSISAKSTHFRANQAISCQTARPAPQAQWISEKIHVFQGKSGHFLARRCGQPPRSG